MRHVPEEVRRAIERMSTPLHPSWGSVARGATAAADAHSMAVIRAFVLGEDPPTPADGPINAQDLHRRIMNLQAKPYDGTTTYDAYCRGHKDARHAAAEVAMAFDDGMRAAMVKLSRALGNPKDVDAGATQSLEAALIEQAADRLTAQKSALNEGVPDAWAAIAYALERWGYKQGTGQCVAFYRGACWAVLAAPAPARPLVTEFNVGRWCLGEDDCIAQGIDFPAYERGVADAAKAFGRNTAGVPVVHAALPVDRLEQLIDAYLEDYEMVGEAEDGRDACHQPTDDERALIKDAFLGLLANEEWDAEWGKLIEQRAAAPGVKACGEGKKK